MFEEKPMRRLNNKWLADAARLEYDMHASSEEAGICLSMYGEVLTEGGGTNVVAVGGGAAHRRAAKPIRAA